MIKEFPKMLYRGEGGCEQLIVASEDEQKAAMDDGWYMAGSPPKPKRGRPKKVKEE